jgi:hypothetical protein
MGTRLTLSRMAMSGRAMSNPGIGRERSMRMTPSPFDRPYIVQSPPSVRVACEVS